MVKQVNCVVKSCPSNSKWGSTLHRIPPAKDLERHNKWIKFIQDSHSGKWTQPPYHLTKICNHHFEDEDFYVDARDILKLKCTAIPTIIQPSLENETLENNDSVLLDTNSTVSSLDVSGDDVNLNLEPDFLGCDDIPSFIDEPTIGLVEEEVPVELSGPQSPNTLNVGTLNVTDVVTLQQSEIYNGNNDSSDDMDSDIITESDLDYDSDSPVVVAEFNPTSLLVNTSQDKQSENSSLSLLDSTPVNEDEKNNNTDTKMIYLDSTPDPTACSLCKHGDCRGENVKNTKMASDEDTKILDGLLKLLESYVLSRNGKSNIDNKVKSLKNKITKRTTYTCSNDLKLCKNCCYLIDLFNYCSNKCNDILKQIIYYISEKTLFNNENYSYDKHHLDEDYAKVASKIDKNYFKTTKKPNIVPVYDNPVYTLENQEVLQEVVINPLDVNEQSYERNTVSLLKNKDKKLKELNKKRTIVCPLCCSSYKFTVGQMHTCSQYKDSLVCKICEVKFTNYSVLDSHLNRTHLYKQNRSCPKPDCDKSFTLKLTLKCHLYKHHPLFVINNIITEEETVFSALATSLNLPKKETQRKLTCKPEKSVSNETTTSAENQSYKCLTCDMTFGSNSQLNVHMLVHEEDCLHTCTVCDKKFKSRVGMFKHFRHVHMNVPVKYYNSKNKQSNKTFPCSECGIVYKHSNQLKDHMFLHGKKWPYTCGFCNKKLASKLSMNEHINRQHLGILYKCDQCPRRFKVKSSLENHVQRIHIINNNIYKCKVCDKGFNVHADLKKHLRCHKKSTHKCNICNKKYKFEKLKLHMKRMHETKENSCPLCIVSFSSFVDLRFHMSDIHEIKNIKEDHDKSNHMCIICGCIFISTRQLSFHVRSKHLKN